MEGTAKSCTNAASAALGERISVAEIAEPFRAQIRDVIATKFNGRGPHLVAFLASGDEGALKYASWTHAACIEDGIDYELRIVKPTEIEEKLDEANRDPNVHGILIYYPLFGSKPSFFGNSMDQYLRDCVAIEKDVEALSHTYRFNLYRDIRFLDQLVCTKPCVVPCTPLAIVKILDYLGLYGHNGQAKKSLSGKVISVINRSEIVGHPLAAMLANDGATVFSIDIDAIFRLEKGKLQDTSETPESACRMSNVIVTGVPSKEYRLPTEWVQPNTVIVNFSHFKNVDEAALNRIPGTRFVPLVGKVTVAMLERNCLRLYESFHRNL